jgi:hypothetical protein
VEWDGVDEQGNSARPGVYFACLIVNGVRFEHRLPLIR